MTRCQNTEALSDLCNQPDPIGIEEGDVCNRVEDPEEGAPKGYRPKPCSGTMVFPEVKNCSCHISPPCENCVSAGLVCSSCGYETDPKEDPEPDHYDARSDHVDRSREFTSTKTANPFNSTPFTRCCGVAAINKSRCPRCNAQIQFHDDGLAEARRLAKGGCLMCGRPHGDIAIAGNCCC